MAVRLPIEHLPFLEGAFRWTVSTVSQSATEDVSEAHPFRAELFHQSLALCALAAPVHTLKDQQSTPSLSTGNHAHAPGRGARRQGLEAMHCCCVTSSSLKSSPATQALATFQAP